jgi:hypothetical protein
MVPDALPSGGFRDLVIALLCVCLLMYPLFLYELADCPAALRIGEYQVVHA